MRQVIDLPLPGDEHPPRRRQVKAEQLPLPVERQEEEPQAVPSRPTRYRGDLRHEAWQRMLGLAATGGRSLDPVYNADRKTSMDDARIALSIAKGVPINDIDPGGGYALTHHAYLAARRSWREQVEGHGWSEYYDRPAYEEAYAYWVERRPEFTDGDDWVADLIPTSPEPKDEDQ
ncbi:hypothetical protein ACWGVR_14505 [Streptomyces xanthophaeus]